MKTGSIYALAEPETGRVRYVGKTLGGVDARLKGHLSAAKCDSKPSPVTLWVRSLMERGLEPIVVALRRDVPEERLASLEASWIGFCRQRGCSLLNQVKGFNRSWRSVGGEELEQIRILDSVGVPHTEIRFHYQLTKPGLEQVLRKVRA